MPMQQMDPLVEALMMALRVAQSGGSGQAAQAMTVPPMQLHGGSGIPAMDTMMEAAPQGDPGILVKVLLALLQASMGKGGDTGEGLLFQQNGGQQ